jgi:hypothetical protein
MGNRSHIKIGKVWFYGHWLGSDCFSVLKDALIQGRDRWGDEEYLTAIIARQLLKDDINGTTSFGIGTSCHGDIEHHIPEVDCEKGRVLIRDLDGKKTKYSYTIEEFIDPVNFMAILVQLKEN